MRVGTSKARESNGISRRRSCRSIRSCSEVILQIERDFETTLRGAATTRGASAFARPLSRVDSDCGAGPGEARHRDCDRGRGARRARSTTAASQEGDGSACCRNGMKQQTPWSLIAPLGVCLLLTGWIALSAANLQTASLSLLIYGLANLIVYTDALDFILRLHVRRRHIATAPTEENRHLSIDLTSTLPAGARQVVPVRPYAIIASIHNLEPLLDEFMDAFAAYRDRVWLISDGSTDNTVLRLRRAGWRCFDDGVNRRKPAAIRRLLERLPTAHRNRAGRRSGHSHSRTRCRQPHRFRAVRPRFSAVRRRRRLPARHDRARWFPRALSGVRIRPRLSHRPRKPRRLQHHLRRIVLSPRCTGARARRAYALGVRGGPRERAHSVEPRRTHLLRRSSRREHRRPRQRAALVFATRRLVLRPDQGLHRTLRQDLAHRKAHAVLHVSLRGVSRRPLAGPAPAEDRQRARCWCSAS